MLLALTIVVSLQTVGRRDSSRPCSSPRGHRVAADPAPAADDGGSPAAFGAASSVIGLYASYYLDVVSGAAIVLTATAFFLLAFLFAPQTRAGVEVARRAGGQELPRTAPR